VSPRIVNRKARRVISPPVRKAVLPEDKDRVAETVLYTARMEARRRRSQAERAAR